MICCYTPSNASDHVADSAASPTKRRHIDTSPPSIPSVLEGSEGTSPQSRDAMQAWDQTPGAEQQQDQQHHQQHQHMKSEDSSMSGMTTQPPISIPVLDHVRHGSLHNFKKLPSRNNANGLSEETNIYTETRMLQDQTGRLRRLTDRFRFHHQTNSPPRC